ncbi:hypothetical protein [[Clostridium] aminophilum]|uniref:hypothetical protein n=1 Tax=[Clostridium] aminophilum TaxID=1526 RepID=UPI0033165ED7
MKIHANASDITHILAKLGGGSKKTGGEGMIGGLKMIFKTGVLVGHTEKKVKDFLNSTNNLFLK